MSTVNDLVLSEVYAPLGAPTLPQELSVQPQDIELALNRYYSYVPVKKTSTHSFTTTREFGQQISELLPDENYFYVGVVTFSVRQQTVSPRLNEYLLGTTYVFPNADPLKQSFLNTQLNENIGDPYYEENFVDGVVNWVVGGSCTLSVTYGLGHIDIEKVPRRHIRLLSYLVGQTYYKRILSIRKSASFNAADFKLDVSLIEKALEDSKTEGDEYLNSIGLFPVTQG